MLLLAHPRRTSFNHAIAATAADALQEAGHEVDAHDLYAERFDPLLRAEECYTTGSTVEHLLARSSDPLVRRHRDEIARAEGLVVVHPNWWGKPPAVLAGWLDRVLVPGVAYRLDDPAAEPEGLLRLRWAMVVNTTDTPASREAAMFGDPLHSVWTRCVLPFCGSPRVERLVIGPVAESSSEQRAEWLARVDARARTAGLGPDDAPDGWPAG